MSGAEIAVIAPLAVATLGSAVAMFRMMSNGKKKNSVPPPADHGPCNEAVDRLCVVVEKNVDEQRSFRLAFERWMAREEGRREGLARTGEFPVQP